MLKRFQLCPIVVLVAVATVPVTAAQAESRELKKLTVAAEKGDADAQNSLATAYAAGEGVQQDDAEAVKWFRRAAEQGYASAQFNLGVMFARGRGVLQDHAEAAEWYRLAAEQGDTNAQFNLGLMYHYGRGVLRDPVQAHKWYNLAASNQEEAQQRDESLNNRDSLAQQMTSDQIARARGLARSWKPKAWDDLKGELE